MKNSSSVSIIQKNIFLKEPDKHALLQIFLFPFAVSWQFTEITEVESTDGNFGDIFAFQNVADEKQRLPQR